MKVLDEKTFKETEKMIDAVVLNGNIQMRLNGQVLNVLQERIMFTDVETIERSFAYAIFRHGMQLDQIENFLKVCIPNSPFKGFKTATHGFFQTISESRYDIVDHIDDIEYCNRMAEGDYIYTLVLCDILQQMKDPELVDVLEYSKIYSLEKSYGKLVVDLAIIEEK